MGGRAYMIVSPSPLSQTKARSNRSSLVDGIVNRWTGIGMVYCVLCTRSGYRIHPPNGRSGRYDGNENENENGTKMEGRACRD